MHRIIVALCFGLMALVTSTVSSHAAGVKQHPMSWQQHDTAVYVVSTLNLLRTPSGDLVVQKLNAAHFDVYSDTAHEELYFITIRSKDGGTAAILAYRMGWLKPRSLAPLAATFGIRQAPRGIQQAYHTDGKQLIGTFDTTLPVQ